MVTVTRLERRDAAENSERILASARALLAERGIDVTLHDIARHAGLGVATIYRRFANRDELLDLLFAESVDRLRLVARHAGTIDDPWEGFVYLLEHSIEMMAEDRGLWTMTTSAPGKVRQAAASQEHFWAVIPGIITRAQQDGSLRADLRPSDVGMICVLVGTSADFTSRVRPGAWRRYLAFVLDGLRARPHDMATIEIPALSADEYEAALSIWRPSKR